MFCHSSLSLWLPQQFSVSLSLIFHLFYSSHETILLVSVYLISFTAPVNDVEIACIPFSADSTLNPRRIVWIRLASKICSTQKTKKTMNGSIHRGDKEIKAITSMRYTIQFSTWHSTRTHIILHTLHRRTGAASSIHNTDGIRPAIDKRGTPMVCVMGDLFRLRKVKPVNDLRSAFCILSL